MQAYGGNQIAIRMMNIEQGIRNLEVVSGNLHFYIGYSTLDILRFAFQLLRKSQRSFTEESKRRDPRAGMSRR
jgi:hypothetical protein